MPLNVKPPKVIFEAGTHHSLSLRTGDKSQITVLACCNAAGIVIPPFTIFDRKTLKPEWNNLWLIRSEWMNSELFELWFLHHFLPHTHPLLLLLDGHSSHYNPVVIRKATQKSHTILSSTSFIS